MRIGQLEIKPRRWLTLPVAVCVLVVPVLAATAAQLPAPGSNLYLQTSGPDAGLGIGDYYTSPAGGDTDHLFVLRVPADWPAGVPVTVSLYDPEVAGPDPASPSAIDEQRGAADTTTFTIESPTGATLATRSYSDATTNGVWAHLGTFDPGVSGTGSYRIRVAATGDDDNSWRVDASHDPDCIVGGPDTCAGVVDGNETDIAPGGSGPLGLGVLRTSYQHGVGGNQCQDHVFHVGPGTPRPLRAHNFDMDGSGSVTYTAPSGTAYAGTVSTNAAWNNSSDANRVGDVLADVNGWWTATVCISSGNQYVFEAPGVSPTFAVPQAAARLAIGKDDGVASVAVGDDTTYSIRVENVSDEDPRPGDAHAVVVVDELPTGLTFVSCLAPAGVNCAEDAGVVTAAFDGVLRPGESFTFDVTARVGADATAAVANTATVAYEDHLGNAIVEETSSDSDDVVFAPVIEVEATGPASVLRGGTVSVELTVAHATGTDGSPVAGLTLDCDVCTANYVSGDDDGDGALDATETWVFESDVVADDGVADPLEIVATATGTDGDGDVITAGASHIVDIVETAAISGSVFEDLDGDGARDAGEPGIDGADVTLTDSVGTDTVANPVAGEYSFVGLAPGTYAVTVAEATIPAGMASTTTLPSATALAEGSAVGGLDFGYARPVVVQGLVFEDVDRDGTPDPGEAGIAGVIVELRAADGSVIADSVTDSVGNYRFDTMPGDLAVGLAEGAPAGWSLTTADEASLGTLLSGSAVTSPAIGMAVTEVPPGTEPRPAIEPPPAEETPISAAATPEAADEMGGIDLLPFTGIETRPLVLLGMALVAGGFGVTRLRRDEVVETRGCGGSGCLLALCPNAAAIPLG